MGVQGGPGRGTANVRDNVAIQVREHDGAGTGEAVALTQRNPQPDQDVQLGVGFDALGQHP